MAEISAKIMRNHAKPTKKVTYEKMTNMKKMRNSVADIPVKKFLVYGRNFSQIKCNFVQILAIMAEISVISQKFLYQNVGIVNPHAFHIGAFSILYLHMQFWAISHYFGRNFCHIAEISVLIYRQQ